MEEDTLNQAEGKASTGRTTPEQSNSKLEFAVKLEQALDRLREAQESHLREKEKWRKEQRLHRRSTLQRIREDEEWAKLLEQNATIRNNTNRFIAGPFLQPVQIGGDGAIVGGALPIRNILAAAHGEEEAVQSEIEEIEDVEVETEENEEETEEVLEYTPVASSIDLFQNDDSEESEPEEVEVETEENEEEIEGNEEETEEVIEYTPVTSSTDLRLDNVRDNERKRKASSPIGEGRTKQSRLTLVECPVCLEALCEMEKSGKLLLVATCGHIMCSNCAMRIWIQRRKRCGGCQKRRSCCPKCHRKFEIETLQPVYL